MKDDVSHLPWRSILSSDCPVTALNTALSAIVSARVPKRLIQFNSRNEPWFDARCVDAHRSKQVAYKRWSRSRTLSNWEDYVVSRRSAGLVYDHVERSFNERCAETLSSSVSCHKWWATLKSVVFGVQPSIPPLLGNGGNLISSPESKATLLNAHFDSKQCRDQFDHPYFCYPAPRACSVAFRASLVKRFLLDLDNFGGADPYGFFPLFFKMIADVLAPKLATLFRYLVRSGTFPDCWKIADVVPVPKELHHHRLGTIDQFPLPLFSLKSLRE